MISWKAVKNVMYIVASALFLGLLAGVLTFFLFTEFGVGFDTAATVSGIVGCLFMLIVIMDDD